VRFKLVGQNSFVQLFLGSNIQKKRINLLMESSIRILAVPCVNSSLYVSVFPYAEPLSRARLVLAWHTVIETVFSASKR